MRVPINLADDKLTDSLPALSAELRNTEGLTDQQIARRGINKLIIECVRAHKEYLRINEVMADCQLDETVVGE